MQYGYSGGQVSSAQQNNAGVHQDAILSASRFSFHLDSLVCDLVNRIKYADDFVLSGKCKTVVDFNALSNSLVTISYWSRAHNFQLNTQKCIQCDFALTKSQTSSIPQLALGGTILPFANDFKNLSVSSSSDLTWSYHVANITSRCHGFRFVSKSLWSSSIPQYAIFRFLDACALHTILYSSPGIRLRFATNGLRTTASNDGIPCPNLRETIITRHFATCNQLASRTLGDSIHPLHSYLEVARTRRSTRQIFRLLPARTDAYRKTTIPF